MVMSERVGFTRLGFSVKSSHLMAFGVASLLVNLFLLYVCVLPFGNGGKGAYAEIVFWLMFDLNLVDFYESYWFCQ